MGSIHTDVVRSAHPYTRSKTPWRLDRYTQTHDASSRGLRVGWRLYHYLSGGGMSAFGRTVGQDEVSRHQRRFLVWAGLIGVLWLVFLVV